MAQSKEVYFDVEIFEILKKKSSASVFEPTCTEPTKGEVEKAVLVLRATIDHQIQDYFPKKCKYLASCPHQRPQGLGQSLNKNSI